MRDPRLEHARKIYLSQESALNSFRLDIENALGRALVSARVVASVSGRVKTLDSLLKKLILKPVHTYETLSDKVGVRVVSNDRLGACEVVRQCFDCLNEEDKDAGRDVDRLGYPGVHFDVTFRGENDLHREYSSLGFRCEIQVRTFAEHSWCDVSHKVAYKSGSGEVVPKALNRRLMLTIGLLEMADLNLNDIADQFKKLPDFTISRAIHFLEENYFRFTARPSAREVTFIAVNLLLPLYRDVDDLEARVVTLIAAKTDILRQVFRRNERLDESRALLFFQPEILMIFDLLIRKPEDLMTAWAAGLPLGELSDIAAEFGRTLPEIES